MKAYILTAVLLAAVAAGCKKVDPELEKVVTDHVELTDTDVILASSGRTQSTIVTSDLEWTLEGGAEWCEPSTKSGGAGTSTIYFTAQPNPEYDDRSTNYTLVTGDKRLVITVYQKKLDAIIFDKDKFDDIAMDGGEIEVTMETNVNYTIDMPESWIERLPQGTTTRGLERKIERFRIASTDEWDERVGRIVFISEDNRLRDTVTVYQVQRDKILLTPSSIRPVIEGQTIRVQLRANVEYEITVPEEYADWLSYTTDGRPDVLLVTAAETDAERYGEIVLRDRNNPGTEAVLEVWQVEMDRVLFEEELLEVAQEGGTYTLDVLDNVEGNYELIVPEYAASWIGQAPVTRAMASSRVAITVDANPEGMIERRAKLFLHGTVNDTLVSVPLQVVQKGREVVADDIEVLKAIQAALGFKHNNWPGGASTSISYSGATVVDKVEHKTDTEPTITTTIGGTVTVLNMPRTTLFNSGTYTNTVFPDIVGDLQDLTSLTLNGHFTGDVPISIASLSKLTTLAINGQDQGANTSLNRLPPELGGLESLTSLTLSHYFSRSGQDLEGMLDFVGDITTLKTLNISNCYYGEKMPESWGNLKNLTSLTLKGTGFTDLSAISEMTALEKLDIQTDSLVALPDLSRLTKLTSVTLSNNKYLKDIGGLMTCGSLTSITIMTNYLDRIDNYDWSALVNVTTLSLNGGLSHPSKIKGTLPASIGAMTKLTALNVSYNELEGEIPAEFGNLVNLTSIGIQFNEFTRIAEGVVSKWGRVTTLNINNNKLVEIPADIVEMTWLRSLNGANNEFTGEIPADIGNMVALTSIDLSRDPAMEFMSPGLTGFIPTSITKLSSLKTLKLANNNLIGALPAAIGDIGALDLIYLNDNNLSGEIPLSLTRLKGIPMFEGGAPPFISVRLQNNNLTGYISDDFRNVKLTELDLRNNNLIGAVPAGLVEGPNSLNEAASILHLSGNRLTGVIPPTLKTKMGVDHRTPWQILEQQEGYGLTLE